MPVELEFTKLEDPFLHSSSFSLIPKTLATRSGSSRVETIENLFKSLVAKGSPKMMQQAQIVSNSFGDIDNLFKEDGNIDANCKHRGQERRPALGRKRARFSIKPDVPSCPKPDANISSGLDDIDDPDEYFRAFEQKQNADKAVQKLRGGAVMDVMHQDLGTKTRHRRPGLLGKRPSYKHRISEDDAMAETLAKSQDDDALNCSTSLINSEPVDGPLSQANNTNSKLQEAELEDSVLENEYSKLDDLISQYKDLDEGEDETFMREISHLKPIDVGKLQLPVLPNIHFGQHSAAKRTTHAQSEHFNILSPSARSPLVSVSILKKRMSVKNMLDDINTFHTEDISPDSSISKSAGKKSLANDKLENEDDIYSSVIETDRVVELSENHSLSARNTNPESVGRRNRKSSILDDYHGDLQEGDYMQHDPLIFDELETEVWHHDSQPKVHEVLEDVSHLIGENANNDINAKKDNNVLDADECLRADVGSSPNEFLISNVTAARHEILVPNRSKSSNSGINSETPLSEADADLEKNMPDVRIPQGFSYFSVSSGTKESCPAEVTILRTNQHELPDNNTKDHASVPPSNVPREQKASKRAPSKRKNNRGQNVAENSSPRGVTDITNLPSENQQVLPDRNNEHQVASTLPSNETRKQKAPSCRKSMKGYKTRQSLAGAGTVWESGKRKSSRHRFRPLEHWNGERLLYGRIHNSLATVIGVKYASPGKEHLKIESYVPNEFADLVARAARC